MTGRSAHGEPDFPRLASDAARPGLAARLLTRRVGRMLVRNSIVSSFVFLIGLGLLWVLVQHFGMKAVPAAAIGFLVSNSLHYALGRSWIFRGTDRKIHTGYLIFLINAGLGLAITVILFAALLQWTPIHYLVARVIVSLFAGLAMFVLNAVVNFRQV
ncbi:GtrA family protein [Sphingopyxis indica]|uniref:GtrA family protein n=1 Tax=Sphingopyxis indica TaxID=436663 RepID=UPI0029390C9E|nr:GtrA family protein [Sphingopyxis indica]WOF44441.1 GtrA family protein [Sphingopyxis indica]